MVAKGWVDGDVVQQPCVGYKVPQLDLIHRPVGVRQIARVEHKERCDLPDSTGAEFTGAVVSWTSDNPQIARVDSSGGVTAAGAGAALIEARAGTQRAHAVVQVVSRASGRPASEPELRRPVTPPGAATKS